MEKLSAKNILIPAVVLVLICIVVTSLLAVTNSLTKGPIKEQEILKAESTRKIVVPLATEYKELNIEDIAKDYQAVEECYGAFDESGNLIGYTLTTSQSGYAGAIKMMVGIDIESNAISGVAILSQTETPGLGANAENESYTNQYKQPIGDIEVVKNPPADGQVQALTGATITSDAVTLGVNNMTNFYEEVLKGNEFKFESVGG